jgi:hypothetical protein
MISGGAQPPDERNERAFAFLCVSAINGDTMNARQAALVAALVALAAIVVVAPAVGTVATTSTASVQEGSTNESTNTSGANETSLGAQLSGYMQASTESADGSVDSSMWAAEFDGTSGSDRAALVDERVGQLEARLDGLEDRMAAVEAARENGTLPEPAYVAQASQLSERVETLEDAINQTEDAATAAGLNDSRLDRLRENASELEGREVAKVARDLSVVTPPGLTDRPETGPPVDVGPPDDIGPPDVSGNGTGPPDAAGPPDDDDANPPGDDAGPPNGDDAGRPGDAGPPDDGGDDTGPPDESGAESGSDGSDGSDASDRADEPDGNDADDSDDSDDDDDGAENDGNGDAGPAGGNGDAGPGGNPGPDR